uniref:RNase H type-1 domain-containing protein n=1 Tax=Cannabis sativa TaxID=3483 RepID=A0A803QD93_CANSA
MGKEVGNSSIAIFFDAQMVVRALKERSFPPYWEVRPSAKKVLNFDVCNFLYIPRVDNRGANNVAKKARSKGHFDGVFDKEGHPVVIPNYLVL